MATKYILLDQCDDILFESNDLEDVIQRREEWVDYYNEEQDSNHTAKNFSIYVRTDY